MSQRSFATRQGTVARSGSDTESRARRDAQVPLSSPGQALSAELRALYEPRFGHDFSRVRIHSGGRAASVAEGLHARAYTLHEAIVWGGRDPLPGAGASQQLLAHELAHVVQQRRGSTGSGEAAATRSQEAEAHGAATRVARGLTAPVRLAAAPSVPLLQDIDEPAPQGRPVPTFGNSPGALRQLSSTEWTLQGFATDSAELTQEHERVLAAIARELNQSGLGLHGFVTIWGRADSRGTQAHSRALGQRRADQVRARLAELVTDPEIVGQIRARSIGEELNEQPGAVAEYRQVSVTISRGDVALGQPPWLRSPSLEPSARAPIEAPDLLRPNLTLPPQGPLAPLRPTLPPNFWQLPPQPAPRDLLNDLSRALTGPLGRREIAGLAGRIAGGLGMDEASVRRQLDEALVSGGEAGLREALRALLSALVGPPTSPPPNQYGPPLQELPTPPIFSTPPIPLPF